MIKKKFTRDEIEALKKKKLGQNAELLKAMIVRKPPSSLTQDNDTKKKKTKTDSDSSKEPDKEK